MNRISARKFEPNNLNEHRFDALDHCSAILSRNRKSPSLVRMDNLTQVKNARNELMN